VTTSIPSETSAAPQAPAPAALPDALAGALVFFASGAVLVLEILAGRMLAPYVGVTLETYTAIIGVVLAGIAFGTWAGGRVADWVDPRLTLGPVLIVGGLLALATLPLVRALGELTVARGGGSSIVLLALFAFLPPAAVLSAVTPTTVKLQLASLRETGAVVGRFSALGTAGALVGTFLTGFALVAELATTPIVLGVGGALVAAGIALSAVLGRGRRRGRPSAAALGALAMALALGALGVAIGDRCQVESAYYCARVEADPSRPSGRLLRLDTLRHSYVDLADPTYLDFDYARLIGDAADVFRPPGAPVDALHIGGGGFTIPRYLDATRPGSRSLVLELDPALLELARERLGLRTRPELAVRTGDARVALARERTGARDLVVGDAFGGVAVPWHLTTLEVVREIRRTLTPRGIYALNVIDYPPSRFVRAETHTLARGFRHVALLAPPESVSGRSGGNFVLLASQAPLPLEGLRERIAARGGGEEVVSGRALGRFFAGAPLLTDEYAPVDQLLTPPAASH
jgi:hypothetical protein